MTNKERKKLFPWNFIVSGILICCLLTCARMAVHDVDNPVVTWFVVMVISVLLGYIPIKIAYRKQTEHKHGIYVLSVVAMSVGSPFISVAAILWACFDKESNESMQKKVEQKSKKSDKTTTWDDDL